MICKLILSCLLISISVNSSLAQGFTIVNLQTDYMSKPLGIDATNPAFSWQMNGNNKERGLSQKAYRILVKNENDVIIWDWRTYHRGHFSHNGRRWKESA